MSTWCAVCAWPLKDADRACNMCGAPVQGLAPQPVLAFQAGGSSRPSPPGAPALAVFPSGSSPWPSGPGPVEVFISHVPADERHRARLEVHLGLMMRQGLLRTCHRGRVRAGEVVDAAVAASLEGSWLVLLLVSADYLASEECFACEVLHALIRHERREAQVVPVLLHACDWASAPFGRLMVLPTGSKPVSSWRNRNEAWADVARGIRRLVEARAKSALAMREIGFGSPPTFGSPRMFGGPPMAAPSPPTEGSVPGAAGSVDGRAIEGGGRYAPAIEEGDRYPLSPWSRPPPLGAPALSWPGSSDTRTDGGALSPRRHTRLLLPAPPVDFLGREDDISDLLQNLGPAGAAIIGPAGVGKTTLALRLALELEPHYAERRIHVELGGAGPMSLHPTLAMVRVLEKIIAGFKPPGDAATLEAMYRHTLSSTPALLLLDDARDPEQVAPLVAGCTRSLFLVMSSQPLALPGLYTRQLGALSADDACALARALAPRLDEVGAGALAAQCQFLPLAIRVAASALAAEATLAPADHLDRLRAALRRLPPAEAALCSSVDLLPRGLQQTWCRLGELDEDFDATGVAQVSGVTPELAHEQLRELETRALVDRDPTQDRWSMHELARGHARRHGYDCAAPGLVSGRNAG
ncbi:toll/interleukin-1 receptor domain-containing protein [Sorangium sp. So ce1014]|uniref:TIR domain-containing protein n=1 Tax=Sorangium sp. So ce1014 TaxID=3133326 RepID=UPI003F5FF883